MKWQYGIRFMSDGSEVWRWSGRTSRLRAEIALANMRAEYPNDRFQLVRRLVDKRGRPIGGQFAVRLVEQEYS